MAKTDSNIIEAAVQEYRLSFNEPTAEVALGNRNAIRGMMVRLGLYSEFGIAINKAFPNIPADRQNFI